MANPLNLPDWVVVQWEENAHDYRFRVTPSAVPLGCPLCAHPVWYRHGTVTMEFRDLPMHGKRVGILVERHRYRCRGCGRTFADPLPGFDDHYRMTVRLRQYLAPQAVKRPFAALADEVGLDEKTVRSVFHEAVHEWDRGRQVETPEVLGIDEVVLQQPRCVLTNVTEQTLVDLLPSRTYPTVVAYLRQFTRPDRVRRVTMDMWRPYRDAVRHVCLAARASCGGQVSCAANGERLLGQRPQTGAP